MGFGSQARLNVHLQYHEKQGKSFMAHQADTDDKEDVELIIIDAVEADDLDLVRDFIADVPRFAEKLLLRAVVSSSCEMLGVLLEACNSVQSFKSYVPQFYVLAYAVKFDKLEATRLLLNRGVSVNASLGGRRCIDLAIDNRSPEMIRILLPYMAGEDLAKIRISTIIPIKEVKMPEEARIIQCLSLLRGWTRGDGLEDCLVINARLCHSVAIAEFLLQHGVDVHCTAMGRTALYMASCMKSKRAAEFMKFLLESGADPRIAGSGKNRPIAERAGPQNISKWFGISWEQLVEESQQKHAASLQMKYQ